MVLNNFIKVACLSTCLGLASGSILANANYNVDTNGGLKVYDNSDNNHWFHLSGKMQLDQTLKHGKSTSSQLGLSTLQADFKGGIGEDTSYSFRLNKDGNLTRAQLSFAGFNSWSKVTVGQVAMPYGLDSGSSFNKNLALKDFGLKRNLGLNIDTWNDRMGLNFGLSQNGDNPVTTLGDLSTSARLSFAPVNRDNLTVHFGLSGYYTNNRQAVSVDAAVLRGPALLQGEFHHSGQDANTKLGWNVEASYALTGETRSYDYRKGSFGSLQTDRDSGSWEVSLRHSQLDKDKTLGANVSWTVNNNVTLLANYNNDMEKENNSGDLSLRLQAAW
jgi:phosphate-selective porin